MVKKAKNLYKALNKKIDIKNIEEYLETKGYSVVFFNKPEGDALLSAYGIDRKGTQAFTFCGITKIVFVDNNMHIVDKIHCLLHECGHILLGDLEDKVLEYNDRKELEGRAELFVFLVMNQNKIINRKMKIFVSIFVAILSLHLLLYFLMFGGGKSKSETVFITKSGEKYHTEDCIYINSENSIAVPASEAEKIYSRCEICGKLK